MPQVPASWSWDDGQPSFSAEVAAVAVNNLDGTIGTPVRVPSIKTVVTDIKMLSDQAQGDTAITAIASQILSIDLTIDFSGISKDVYQKITGVAPTSSSSPDRTYVTYANNRMPYFAFILESLGAEDLGDMLVFLPKCKIVSNFTWKWDFGKIIVPQVKCQAIKDLVLGYCIQTVERDAVAAIMMPPA